MKKNLFILFLSAVIFTVTGRCEARTLEEILVDKGILSEEEARSAEAPVYAAKGIKFSLWGEMEFEYINNEAAGFNGHFALDSIALHPGAVTKNGIILDGEIKTGSDSKLLVEEIHATFTNLLPGGTFLRAGKDDRFIKRSRITEAYPLAGTLFWQDDVEGIWAGGELGGFYWDAEVTNSFQLTTKSPLEETATDIVLHDDRARGTNGSEQEYGLGLGYQIKSENASLDTRLFYFDGKVGVISDNTAGDIAALGITSDDNRDFIGTRLSLTCRRISLVGEYISASYGSFDMNVWYLESSFKNRIDGMTYLKGYELLLRYNELDPDVARDSSRPLTWKIKKTTAALNLQLDKTVLLRTEYYILDEENKGSAIDNNELMVQLEYKF